MSHKCHWPTGTLETPPSLWGCRAHWYKLPKILRDKVWDAYVPGQEVRKDPSPEYIDVVIEVEAFARAQIKAGRDVPCSMLGKSGL